MGKRKGDCYQEISLQSSEFCVFCFVFCVEVAQYRQLATTHTTGQSFSRSITVITVKSSLHSATIIRIF